jgi:hypothetical protein
MSPDLDLDDAFEEFMRTANPRVDKTSIQYRESRRVFFAGMFLMFNHLKFLANFPETVAMRVLDDFDRQFTIFRELVDGDMD